jgi:2-C-methyl-D-erythritol 4-phosphate cytidylyltransferase
MLAWSLETFAQLDEIAALAIATEPEWIREIETLAAVHAPRLHARVVAGGAERQDSVRLALEALPAGCGAVLVHDGARPLVRAGDVRRGMEAVGPGTASFLAARVIDTIKEVDAGGRVLRTLERSLLWAAQTPQFALAGDLRGAHREAAAAGIRATDDAALLERAGLRVVAVESSPENFKVTLPEDLLRAEAILRERLPANLRR